MPLYRTLNQHQPISSSSEELRRDLIQEWLSPRQEASEPVIIEDSDETHQRPTQLQVVWNAWQGVDKFVRSVIIMEAFEEVRGINEILNVISAEGLTFEEAKRGGVDLARLETVA